MANRGTANRRNSIGAYSDEADRYSDDFDDDDRDTTAPMAPKKGGGGPNSYFQERYAAKLKEMRTRTDLLLPLLSEMRGRGRGVGPYGRGQRGRGSKRGRGGRGTSRNSEPADMRRSTDTVTARVLSASRNKTNELRNQVEEMKLKMKELGEENKLYKKLQFRQEKAIRGMEDKENDLPHILEKHTNEVRTLKENNRRLREKYDKSDRYLRDAEDELEKANKKLKKYKEIVDEKDLKERDQLTRQLQKTEIDMEEKDVKIKELTRHVEVLKKNHRHELGIEGARVREVKKQMDELTEMNTKLSIQLKARRYEMVTDTISYRGCVSEREVQLDKANIYANRAHEEGLDTESPLRRVKKKTTSMTDLTPRDKAKFYAEKKREEFKKNKEELEKRQEENRKRDVEDRTRRERDDHERKEAEERERRERVQQEEKERKIRVEAERREKEKLEQDRRMEQERIKLENSPAIQEERRKKDDLLKKLQAMDELGSAGTKVSPEHKNSSPVRLMDHSSAGSDKKEWSFTKPVNNLHQGKPSQSHEDKPVPSKTSTGPASNRGRMHRGLAKDTNDDEFGYQPSFAPSKPASKPVSNSKPLSIFDDDEPMFKLSDNKPKEKKPEKDLLADLFGPQATTKSNDTSNKVKHNEDETFFVTSPKKGSSRNAGSSEVASFPWDQPKSNNTSSTFAAEKQNNSSNIFGGGAALIEDDFSSGGNRRLPRRHKQPNMNTFSSKPTVSAIDNFDDEIEEVVL